LTPYTYLSIFAAAWTDEGDTMAIPTTKQTSKAELIALLKDCAEHLEMTDFSPILYQTLGALHEYTGRHAGLPAPTKATTEPRPSFQKSGGINGVLASGWMEEMSSSSRSSSGSSSSNKQIVWKSILALLVQKDNEEPCLWITREVISAEEGGGSGEPELETMHRIPMRRLQTVEYIDFYGDHRLALRIKRREHDLILRCNDDGSSAIAWAQQLEVAKSKGRGGSSGTSKNNKTAEADQSFELETDERTGEVVNLNEEDDDDAAKNDQQPTEEVRRMADRLQEAEDLRRLRNDIEKAEEEKQKRNAEEAERKKQEAAEKTERFKQAKVAARKKLADAAEEQRLKEQHEKAARAAVEQAVQEQQARQKELEVHSLKQQEDEKRQREYALEQQKKAAAEKRRQDLELLRRAAQEEQKKKDLEEKRKFLATEQRKLDMIAKAKAGKGEQPPSTTSLMDKLNTQMSALDAADRMRAEEAKKKAEEEKEQGTQEPEDPDTARKRIAEEARQRLVLEEAEKLRKQSEEQARGQQQRASVEAEAKRQQQAQAWAEQQRRQKVHQQQTYGAAQHYPQPAPGQPQQQAWHTAQHQQQQQQAWNQWQQQQQQHQQGRPAPLPQQAQYQQQHQYTQAQRPALTGQIPGYYGQQQRPPQQAQAQQSRAAGQQYQQQQQQAYPQAATAPGYPGRPQQPPSHHPPTGVDMKYTQMAQQAQQEEQSSSTTELKRNILLHWALQPPANQILRTIDQLLCNIHTVYPPAFGVAAHAYFKGWQALKRIDICTASGALDDDRLKKAVRKLRFFLHPDKLPRDLTEEQLFMCKLLWDVTNDSFEDYKKSAEDLDWVG
jgi:hypothetical protein